MENDSKLADIYDARFFEAQAEGSLRSASIVVPRLLAVLPPITSIVDVGCGVGAWLREFKAHGVERILGLDGGTPDPSMMLIDAADYMRVDISNALPIEGRFDAVLSVEVAEHLPPESSSSFVNNLCRLSDVVIFSAALPGQGGTAHINEKPASAWSQLFHAQGYRSFDIIRPVLWGADGVDWWYVQNLIIYVNKNREDITSRLAQNEASLIGASPLDMVHPRCLGDLRRWLDQDVEKLRQCTESLKSLEVAAEKQLAASREAHVAAEKQLAASREALAAVLQSWSWRLTAPLRALVRSCIRLRRRLFR